MQPSTSRSSLPRRFEVLVEELVFALGGAGIEAEMTLAGASARGSGKLAA